MNSYRNKKFLVCILILCMLLPFVPTGKAEANGNPVILPGANPSAVILSEMKLLSFNNGLGPEIMLGMAGLAEGERTQIDFTGGVACDGRVENGLWLSSNRITLDFSYAFGKLLLEVNASQRYCLEYLIGQPNPLNYLQLDIANGSLDGTVSFDNVRLNGILVGNYSGSGVSSWNFTGLDHSLGFRLEGDLVLTGTQPEGDLNYLGFKIGYLQEDILGPVVNGLVMDPDPVYLHGKVKLEANIDDQLTGGSLISAAEFSLDGGDTWENMIAIDGAFDETVEAVAGEFGADSISLSHVCVRGIDSRGNVGEMACAEISVLYQFEGFFRPVQMGVINSVKAGRTIPIKWLLRDANGMVVMDRASFEGLYSYPVDCKTWIGDPSLAVQEFSTNSKGLMLTEDGTWQFNWKTSKNYLGTCRIMYVELVGDSQSPGLQLKFR